MRGRVLSNGLELLFRKLRSMANVPTDVILTVECIPVPGRAKDAVGVQQLRCVAAAAIADDLIVPVVLPVGATGRHV